MWYCLVFYSLFTLRHNSYTYSARIHTKTSYRIYLYLISIELEVVTVINGLCLDLWPCCEARGRRGGHKSRSIFYSAYLKHDWSEVVSFPSSPQCTPSTPSTSKGKWIFFMNAISGHQFAWQFACGCTSYSSPTTYFGRETFRISQSLLITGKLIRNK